MPVNNFTCHTNLQSDTDLKKLMIDHKWMVLYFYPKDMTSGCTQESIDFSNMYSSFKGLGAQVVGISKDSVKSHIKFQEKHELPFELIADESQEICHAFDVMKEKSMYGRKYMGIVRSTFILDADLNIVHEWRNVKVGGHVEAVLKVVEAL
jgi:peroxiredoxin Q/BCP